jgi:hypothetical protein
VLTAINSIVNEEGKGSLISALSTVGDALGGGIDDITVSASSLIKLAAVRADVPDLSTLAHVNAVLTSCCSKAVRPRKGRAG